jgi:heat shock protein HslJ
MRMRLSAVVAALILLSASIGAVACRQGSGASAHVLDGTSWRLTGWTLSSLDPKGFTITATFADGKISGHSGVNTYGGPYTAGPTDAFSIGDLSVTAMGGTGPDMQAEQAYLTRLGEATSFTRDGDRLTLLDKSGDELLVFQAASS